MENSQLKVELSMLKRELELLRQQLETTGQSVERQSNNCVSDTEKEEKKKMDQKIEELEETLKVKIIYLVLKDFYLQDSQCRFWLRKDTALMR